MKTGRGGRGGGEGGRGKWAMSGPLLACVEGQRSQRKVVQLRVGLADAEALGSRRGLAATGSGGVGGWVQKCNGGSVEDDDVYIIINNKRTTDDDAPRNGCHSPRLSPWHPIIGRNLLHTVAAANFSQIPAIRSNPGGVTMSLDSLSSRCPFRRELSVQMNPFCKFHEFCCQAPYPS